jgi:cell shape-determining protein MreC
MTYLQRSSEKKKQNKKKLLVLVIFSFILILGVWGRNTSARFVHLALFPVRVTTDFIFRPFKNIGIYFDSKVKIENRNRELEDENRMLKIEILSSQALQKQNQELRQILNVRGENAYNRIVAQVLSTPPFSPFDTFVVRIPQNFAEQNGEVSRIINQGQKVFIKNILVGEISESYLGTAIVKLYSTFEEKIPVRINGEIIAEAEGMSGLSFKIELPKDLPIEIGRPVYSMTNPEFIIGFVDEIVILENSSFQNIYFKYPFNFNSFNFVEIEY